MAGDDVLDRLQRFFDHLDGGAGVIELQGEEHNRIAEALEIITAEVKRHTSA
ncbi:hypothetical protein [Streptomyces sp. NPDC001100]